MSTAKTNQENEIEG